jgi:hypothetical protein
MARRKVKPASGQGSLFEAAPCSTPSSPIPNAEPSSSQSPPELMTPTDGSVKPLPTESNIRNAKQSVPEKDFLPEPLTTTGSHHERPWAPRSSDSLYSEAEWEALLKRSRGPWTDAELAGQLSTCPDCGRTVLRFNINTSYFVFDPMPKERQRIATIRKDARFGFRTPMRSLLGHYIRPAHDCHAEEALPDPKDGWKPRRNHEIHDGG